MSYSAKVIIPSDLLPSPAKLLRAVENGLDGAAKGVKADMGVTTRTWSAANKPSFKIERKNLLRVIATGSQIYQWVDEGTRAHTITATRVNPKTGRIMPLMFGVPYRAKTTPGVIGSKSGGAGPNVAAALSVQHPGTRARNFVEVIGKKWEIKLPEIVQRAIDSEV